MLQYFLHIFPGDITILFYKLFFTTHTDIDETSAEKTQFLSKIATLELKIL